MIDDKKLRRDSLSVIIILFSEPSQASYQQLPQDVEAWWDPDY